MEPTAAGLGGPAPVPNIMATLSSLADTLHLSSTNTGAGEHVSAPPASSDVDVTGMLESLSAAVPALGAASAPTGNAPSLAQPLSPGGRGPSGSLSGLGPQLLQLQEQLQVSHDPEPNAKHRSAAAAIAAALQRSAPQEDVAPAAPDFTLLSETVSESLHKHTHTQDPPAPKTSPVPPITPPVSEATPAPSMKPRMDRPDTSRGPPGHPGPPRIMPGQPHPLPPPPVPPNTRQPPLHHVHQHDVRAPLAATSGDGLRGTPSRPPSESMPTSTGGMHIRHAAVSGPRPPKPPVRPAPQPPGRSVAPHQSRTSAPPPGRPSQPPPRPPQHRAPPARPDPSQLQPAARPAKGPQGGSKPFENDSAFVPDGAAKAAESQQARSVVHPHNPLKRVPVATAHALKTTEQPAKAGTGSAGGPVPTSMHRLAAAKASLERKKLSQTPGLADAAAKKAVAADDGGDDARQAPQGSLGATVPATPSGNPPHSTQGTATEKPAVGSQPVASEGVPGQAQGAGPTTSREGSPVVFHAVKLNARHGEKRPLYPAPRQPEDRPAGKRQRQAGSVTETKGRADMQRAAGNKAGSSDGPARPPKGASQWPVRSVNAGGKPAAPDVRKLNRPVMGGSDGTASRHREHFDASRALPKPKVKRSGQALATRSEQKPTRRLEPQAADASSDDDDRAPLLDAAHLARARQAGLLLDSGYGGAAPKPREGRGQASLSAAAPAAAAAQRRTVVRSPTRTPAWPSPQQARQGGTALDSSRHPAKAPRQAERTVAAAPAASPVVRREDWGKAASTGRQHGARSVAQTGLVEAAQSGRAAAGVAHLGEARIRRLVTHDVEVQTEAPDVRDSSMQTTQLWGRSSACQTEAPQPPDTPAGARLRNTVSMSVQCDIGAATGAHGAGSGAESEGEDGQLMHVRAAQRAVQELRRVHALLSPQLQQVLAHHEDAILGLLSSVSQTAEEAAPEANGSGSQVWADGGNGPGEVVEREISERGNDTDAEASARGWEEAGAEVRTDEDMHAVDMYAVSDDVCGGAVEQDQGEGEGHGDPVSPRFEQSNAFDGIACSPDEVPLVEGVSREDSPDEVPVTLVYDEGDVQEDSDDAAPLVQSVQRDREQDHGGDAMRRGPGVPSEGSSDASAAAGEDSDRVVQAAIRSRLRKLLPKADLSVATAKSVRARLEISLRRDLRAHMWFIKEAINAFLADPDAFAVEYAEETALAARLNQPACAAAPTRPGASERGRSGGAAGGHGGRSAEERPVAVGGHGDAGASMRAREGPSAVDGRSPPSPNLVGRLNGSVSVPPKRKGPAVLYCQANKSAKERFRTSMTPEQLREAKAAARAVLD